VVGPVQDPGSGFWPGHRVGPVNPYLKKIQNNIVLVKKQKSTGCNRVLQGHRVGRVTLGHDFSYFFINPARFQPQVDHRAGPGFKTMVKTVVEIEVEQKSSLMCLVKNTFQIEVIK